METGERPTKKIFQLFLQPLPSNCHDIISRTRVFNVIPLFLHLSFLFTTEICAGKLSDEVLISTPLTPNVSQNKEQKNSKHNFQFDDHLNILTPAIFKSTPTKLTQSSTTPSKAPRSKHSGISCCENESRQNDSTNTVTNGLKNLTMNNEIQVTLCRPHQDVHNLVLFGLGPG